MIGWGYRAPNPAPLVVGTDHCDDILSRDLSRTELAILVGRYSRARLARIGKLTPAHYRRQTMATHKRSSLRLLLPRSSRTRNFLCRKSSTAIVPTSSGATLTRPTRASLSTRKISLGTQRPGKEIIVFLINAVFVIPRFETYERRYPDCPFLARGQTWVARIEVREPNRERRGSSGLDMSSCRSVRSLRMRIFLSPSPGAAASANGPDPWRLS
jgi:hypothetical protein